ncbi:MAG: DUF58 domain-containing protein [Aquimonas sp.]|nr:DUF58 domain-containing protein [Aquimonas sp.]
MRPAPALVALLALLALPGALWAFGLLGPGPFLAAACALLASAAVDALLLRRLPSPSVGRTLPQAVALGHSLEVQLALEGAPMRLQLFDLHPPQWPQQGLPAGVQLQPGKRARVAYQLQPDARGLYQFAGIELRLHSPLRLWRQRRRLEIADSVRVYPDFARVSHLALVGVERASRALGAHQHRRRGEGTEFHQLREYRLGDSMRQIDWKASRRALKLISREYQDERNQQLMLVVDTGRRMLTHDGQLSDFDHALNATLLVAYVALRQGDAVGLFASGGSQRHLPATRGLGALDRLLDGVFDLQPSPVATDYLDMALQFDVRQRRRALVLLVTNARDEDIEDLKTGVRQLRRRHLVCVASLREAVLDPLLQREPQALDGALESAAAAHYLEQRQRAHAELRAEGASVLDVTAAELPGALVDHYLAVKRAGRL